MLATATSARLLITSPTHYRLLQLLLQLMLLLLWLANYGITCSQQFGLALIAYIHEPGPDWLASRLLDGMLCSASAKAYLLRPADELSTSVH